MKRDIMRQVGCRCRISSRQKNSPPIYTRDGAGSGMVSGLRRLWHDEGVPLPVFLAVSLYASLAIASSCLAAGGALLLSAPASRSRFPLGRYEESGGGGPFPVPSSRPVFRCPACPTRRSSRPCPAWRRRCPDKCGIRLRCIVFGPVFAPPCFPYSRSVPRLLSLSIVF